MQTTAIYGFIRPDSNDYAYQLGDDMGATVDRLEQVLSGFVTSPDVSNLNAEVTARASADTALSTRVTVLETGRAMAFLRQTITQTNLAAGWQVITFQAEDIDTHDGHNPSVNPSRYTVPAGQGGTYALEGYCEITTSASTPLVARFHKNGTFLPNSKGPYGASVTGAQGAGTGRHLVTLAAGDYIELAVNSGVTFSTTVPVDGGPWLAIERVR